MHRDRDRLDTITDQLLRHVPDPPAPVARPTGSFAGLRPGQRLADKPTGAAWTVLRVDSLGATITDGTFEHTVGREWRDAYVRARTSRKRKGAAS